MSEHDDEIIHRELDSEDPIVEIANAVAELESKEPQELGTLYDTVDHVVDRIFSDPPAPEAQLEVTFTYEGYRVSVDQGGTATFVEVE